MSFSSPSGQGGWQNSPQGQRFDQRFQQLEDRNPRIAQMLSGMGHSAPGATADGTGVQLGGMGVQGPGTKMDGGPIQAGGMGGDAGPPSGGPPPMTPPSGGGQLGNPQGPGFGQTGPGGPPPQQGFWANPSPALGIGTNIGSQMPASVPQPPWRRNYGGSGLSM